MGLGSSAYRAVHVQNESFVKHRASAEQNIGIMMSRQPLQAANMACQAWQAYDMQGGACAVLLFNSV
jgi:hypothetical protein